MSIYKQFVDSAQVAKSANHLDQLGQERAALVMRQKSCAGSARAPVVRMSPQMGQMGSPLGANSLSSTPKSCVARNAYKRMVPAEEFRHNHELHHHYQRSSGKQQLSTINAQSSGQLGANYYQPAYQPVGQPTHLAASCHSLERGSQAPPCEPFYAPSVKPARLNKPDNSCHRGRPVLAAPQLTSASPPRPAAQEALDGVFKTDDPVLLEWLRAMRFDTELECLTALQARTLAIDDNLAGALSVRNSQVSIQEMRLESDYILELTNILIDLLPINFNTIDKFAVEFSNLWALLVRQTEAQTRSNQQRLGSSTYMSCPQSNLTIINCTPRKSLASARTLRPLDDLANKIRAMCFELANSINQHQENYQSTDCIDNGNFEAILRRIKELYGKFVEISIRAECANIVRALQFDFGHQQQAKSTLGTSRLENAPASSASLRPVRVYQSSADQLPLKWALIALWQLTKDDGYICRLLTEMWQTGESAPPAPATNGGCQASESAVRPKPANGVAKRLDYSTTKQEEPQAEPDDRLRFAKPSEICQRFCEKQQALLRQQQQQQVTRSGALSSALKSKQQPAKRLSTIELLIEIIISQPNQHERVDMMNFMQNTKLVDVEELDQSVSAALYTSNQYKVAALRILNHLCINEQAVKTILRCFSTPPPKQGHQVPQNKIIKSIFECYQTAQEHIYQNETVFNARTSAKAAAAAAAQRRSRKRARQVLEAADWGEENSDYGSRQTNSVPTSDSLAGGELERDQRAEDEGDDAVVKEAIRLLIQLTLPFHRSNQGHDYYTLIGRFSIESLVKYLTNIIKSSGNREMVLLSLSALANISFITTEPMKLFGTSSVMLDMIRSSKTRAKDLELRDQTVTILANMADTKGSLDLSASGNELAFLLSCLETCPSRMANYKLIEGQFEDEGGPSLDGGQYARIGSDSSSSAAGYATRGLGPIENKPRDRKPIQMSAEFIEDLDCVCDNQRQTNMPMLCLSRLRPSDLAAMERVHQKTAVALARLALDPSASRTVLRFGGVKQMIDLCKFSNKRNHSDTVLIACLAALRKMAKVIGHETFRHYNALDLIELELNQALEIYGRLYASEV